MVRIIHNIDDKMKIWGNNVGVRWMKEENEKDWINIGNIYKVR
jgi:hypothetical protein